MNGRRNSIFTGAGARILAVLVLLMGAGLAARSQQINGNNVGTVKY
jgi:hypothetical protein